MLQLTMATSKIANLLGTLLKALNTLVIKQVRMLSSKLKAAKPQSELAKA